LFAYRYAYDYNGNRILKQDMRELSVGDLQGVGDYGRIGETGGGQVFGGLATGQAKLQGKLPEQVPLTQATRYIYDPLQRIAGVQYADGKEESFAYDSAGNRALRKYGSQEETYRYDSRNRLTEVARKDSARAENNRITLYQYDNQGNTLQEETRGCTENLLQKSHYDYDGFNKTRKVTVEYFGNEKETPTAVQTQENFYDAENLRYGIVENGERTNFITNGWKVLAEQDESNQTTNRIVLGYGIIASDSLKQEGDGYRYFHWNEHGDTEYITGENGQVLNRYGYDAFGSLTTAEEIVRNRYTYNGEQYDAITSQYYLRARFYNPQVARFTQEDVYRGDGLNLYAYCANNPVMYEDPSGYDGKSKCPKPGEPEGKKKETGSDDATNPNKIETPFKPLTPKQKKNLKQKMKNKTITQNEYNHLEWDRRFNNRRKRGVDRYWSMEKKRLDSGMDGTRDWSDSQKQDIQNRKTPTFNGEPIEGHHKYNALDYPQLADDPNNIYPATNNEHFNRWHGGNWQNDTNGVPNNPNFEEDF
ncbi:RHS repeat-associated core domain-containing protein, partial [Anaerocolumna cellulosilytica]